MSRSSHWIAGIALAALGVALARLAAPHAEAGGAAFTLAGHLTALAGLLTIACGTRRRYAALREAPAQEPSTTETADRASDPALRGTT